MVLDLPVPWEGGYVYIPLEMVALIVFFSITTLWYWRKARLAKRLKTFIIKLQKSGQAEVFVPKRELDTAVEYLDSQGIEQRPFKPSTQYLDTSKTEAPQSAGAGTLVVVPRKGR